MKEREASQLAALSVQQASGRSKQSGSGAGLRQSAHHRTLARECANAPAPCNAQEPRSVACCATLTDRLV
eukprot:CAMPEP_0185594288 /NCGR_PEP_ID=MMETSP0434-20130131/74355_1 /TAXON_ID=626734 ORGANISM="Favella taraikaensis, Strain Fe Narragansett Bay" /NCGR_SAMPLE_ID=MMETSP0434 /ASSEMBLY_ACC=CAM_ASM_000379 /LENGTH=69 /DNA_ID=CAMNT_0028221501 /DNA_START=462 /DNA_END=671 /DNA_ORIENTATION=+